MKIAIVCDWLVTYAGAERVLAEIIQCFPEADLFSVIDFLPKDQRDFIQNKPVTTTYIQKFPFAKKLYKSYLPWMPLAIEQLDLSAYDLVISSSHAVAKGVITGPNQTHVSYVHSPIRYAWDLQHQYLKETGLNKGLKGFFAKRILHRMRLWDTRTANGVDHFIANSHFIARRIWKTYKRNAEVIHPSIDTNKFTLHTNKEDFYLTASRLVPYKRVDLIVESFAHMPDKKLVVIGDGSEMAKIKQKAKNAKNIEILGFQSNETLVHYMQRAKAYVFAAEEDFGLTPVEAQACGTPVIAYGKGGSLETVHDLSKEKSTGLFFKSQQIESLCDAVKLFENEQDKFIPENCANNANNFTSEKFRKKFKQFVLDSCHF